MANAGQLFNNSLFCAGIVWWSVLEKLHRSLHCQPHLKTRPFTVSWVVLGKGHELKKKNLAAMFKNISHLHPTCLRLSSVAFEKRRAKNTEKQSYFPPCQDEWPIAGVQERRRSSQKQLFKMRLVCPIPALLWFGLNCGRSDFENSRTWVQSIESINPLPGLKRRCTVNYLETTIIWMFVWMSVHVRIRADFIYFPCGITHYDSVRLYIVFGTRSAHNALWILMRGSRNAQGQLRCAPLLLRW